MWRAAQKGVPEAQFWIGVAYDRRAGLESKISRRRHLGGSNKPRSTATLTLKLNWDDAMKMAIALSKTMLWLPPGIEKRQNMFQT
jgi:hypothetical protein